MMTFGRSLWGALILLSLMCSSSFAQPGPGGGGGASETPLNHWPFSNTNWLAADGSSPLSFTNLVLNNSGDGGASVLIDSTNTAYLQYAVVETTGNTNLVIDGDGSVSFWFQPAWSSDDQTNGYGPGGYGRLLEIGAYTDQRRRRLVEPFSVARRPEHLS